MVMYRSLDFRYFYHNSNVLQYIKKNLYKCTKPIFNLTTGGPNGSVKTKQLLIKHNGYPNIPQFKFELFIFYFLRFMSVVGHTKIGG